MALSGPRLLHGLKLLSPVCSAVEFAAGRKRNTGRRSAVTIAAQALADSSHFLLQWLLVHPQSVSPSDLSSIQPLCPTICLAHLSSFHCLPSSFFFFLHALESHEARIVSWFYSFFLWTCLVNKSPFTESLWSRTERSYALSPTNVHCFQGWLISQRAEGHGLYQLRLLAVPIDAVTL